MSQAGAWCHLSSWALRVRPCPGCPLPSGGVACSHSHRLFPANPSTLSVLTFIGLVQNVVVVQACRTMPNRVAEAALRQYVSGDVSARPSHAPCSQAQRHISSLKLPRS